MKYLKHKYVPILALKQNLHLFHILVQEFYDDMFTLNDNVKIEMSSRHSCGNNYNGENIRHFYK